jgi:hypothetical protein
MPCHLDGILILTYSWESGMVWQLEQQFASTKASFKFFNQPDAASPTVLPICLGMPQPW